MTFVEKCTAVTPRVRRWEEGSLDSGAASGKERMLSRPSQCTGVGEGPPGSPLMSTASLSLEQFFGPLISVALGHWGREVPGPLVGLRAQSVPPLTLALAFLGHGQSQMSPDSCCFLGLTSSGDSTFPSLEPHCPEVLS